MNKDELEDALNEAVAMGMAQFASTAVEEGYVSEDEALIILERAATNMHDEHAEFHRKQGTKCEHKSSPKDGTYGT